MRIPPERRREIAALGGRESIADNPDHLLTMRAAHIIAGKRRRDALWIRVQKWRAKGWGWERIADKLEIGMPYLRRIRRENGEDNAA
ncbi:MAG TPA: hypothetical protein VG897_12910 [Terriglobales bacterium]|nr:hypothetical protein [Terriglobales bacterium]